MSKLPKYMITVSKTTKLLALSLFVLLPVWSFYVGFRLGEGVMLLRVMNRINLWNIDKNTLTSAPRKLITNSSDIALPVKTLETKTNASLENSFEYPKIINVSVPQDYDNELAAYGASSEVVIAPKGWLGSGMVAADGNRTVELKSQGGVWGTGSKIDLFIASTGTNNALFGAAPYFPWVRQHWSDLSKEQMPKAAIMESTPLTSKLIKYSLKNPPEGYMVSGIVYSDASDHLKDQFWSFVQMEITYPASQKDFANAILNIFVDQHGITK